MVDDFRHKLTTKELKYFKKCWLRLDKLQVDKQVNRVNIWGYNLKSTELHRYQKGQAYKLDEQNNRYNEILIDKKVPRIGLRTNSLNLRLLPTLSTGPRKAGRMLNGSADKSILKKESDGAGSPSKSVSFNSTLYISPITTRHYEPAYTPMKNYESMYKEYLQKVQMNGAVSGTSAEQPGAASTSQADSAVASAAATTTTATTTTTTISTTTEPIPAEDSPPKRKRGRPKGSGNKRRDARMSIPTPSPARKRGWPLGVPRKGYTKRGRPRKSIEFGFHSIVSDIKTITLPSDLWSAHVSVTAKRSQVTFTRVMQVVSSAVPVECDRSVKFSGSLKHLVRINNRDVELLGAPASVRSLRDVQILLEIVNDIGINDPVLDYLNR